MCKNYFIFNYKIKKNKIIIYFNFLKTFLKKSNKILEKKNLKI